MPNKLETIFKKVTGKNPAFIEPPLTGEELARAIKEARRKKETDQFHDNRIIGVTIYEQGTFRGEPFAILSAQTADGQTIGAYVYAKPPEDEELLHFAQHINPTEWFSFNPERPSSSGC